MRKIIKLSFLISLFPWKFSSLAKNMYDRFSRDQLIEEQNKILKAFEEYKTKGLNLNMMRGVQSLEQLKLSHEMLNIDLGDYKSSDGSDIRNYGGLAGTAEARELFRELAGAESINEIIMGGNSALNLMHDSLCRSMIFGVCGSTSWTNLTGESKPKFLCPVPGYDRHFSICEFLGIEMINIPMTDEGPDMDEVERLVKDSSVKGIWCVPKYSNPTGITYSDAVIKRFAALEPSAEDFRIYWDNAYIEHDLSENGDVLLNLFAELKKNGKEDMLYMFLSASKITFPGAAVSAICASEKNVKDILGKMFAQTIGPDKINQTRHVKFLKNAAGVKAHMKKHREILAPKFKAVQNGLEKNLSGIASWSKPNGGYFVSLCVPSGCALRTVELARELGVILTPAGATYPYGKDPSDENIRIAPSYPSVAELEAAVEALCICVKMAYLEKLIKQ